MNPVNPENKILMKRIPASWPRTFIERKEMHAESCSSPPLWLLLKKEEPMKKPTLFS
jgi:hypothetical protein